jgi:hypothetical protein
MQAEAAHTFERLIADRLEEPVEATVEEYRETVEAPVSTSLTGAFSSGGGI